MGHLTGIGIDLAGTAGDQTIGQIGASGSAVTYNPAGQIGLITHSNDSYAWTAHSNVERDYASNGLGQYTTAGGAVLGYDGRGNLTGSGATTYSYNRLNQLTGSSSGTTMAYDPRGRLLSYGAGGVVTQMGYAGANLSLERSSAGTVLRRYVFGPGNDNPVVWYEGSGTADRRWLQGDERGSVVAVSNAAGTAIAINRYDEYGIPQPGNLGRFQYTGQTWYPELGLYNYKARWYSPSLGRFMQTDPIGYKDQINLYAYVGNDPINFTDPWGLQSEPTVMSCRNSNDIPMGDYTRATGYRCVPMYSIEEYLKEKSRAQPQIYRTRSVAPQSKPQPSSLGCFGSALWTNKTGIALDVAGWVANAAVPEASVASAVVGSTLGVAGIAGAVVDNNGPVDAGVSGTIAYTGKQAAIANSLMRGTGSAIAGRIGFGSLLASSAYDAYKTYNSYQGCMSGKGGQ